MSYGSDIPPVELYVDARDAPRAAVPGWLVCGASAAASFVVCLLAFGQASTSTSLYVPSLARPLVMSSVPGVAVPPLRPLQAEPDAEGGWAPPTQDLIAMLSEPADMLAAEPRPGARVQLLDDDDLEIPSQKQKRAIRRKSIMDYSRWQMSENDVGSFPVQIAQLTQRISSLSKHLQINKKDFSAKRTITQLTSNRRKMLNYLWERDPGVAVDLIQELGIRWRTPEKGGSMVPQTGPVPIPIPAEPTRPRTIPKANQLAGIGAGQM